MIQKVVNVSFHNFSLFLEPDRQKSHGKSGPYPCPRPLYPELVAVVGFLTALNKEFISNLRFIGSNLYLFRNFFYLTFMYCTIGTGEN